MSLQGIVTRAGKGSALTYAEMDGDITTFENAISALQQLFSIVLNPDGSLKTGAVGSAAVIADGIITAAKFAAGLGIVSTGMVIAFTKSGSVPAGYLECDGTAVSRTTYATLFALIGTDYGVGNGTTTFNVPNYAGRALIGQGTGPANYMGSGNAALTPINCGGVKGVEGVTLDVTQIPAHHHAIQYDPNVPVSGGVATGVKDHTGAGSSIVTEDTGGGLSHPNWQPLQACVYIIKT